MRLDKHIYNYLISNKDYSDLLSTEKKAISCQNNKLLKNRCKFCSFIYNLFYRFKINNIRNIYFESLFIVVIKKYFSSAQAKMPKTFTNNRQDFTFSLDCNIKFKNISSISSDISKIYKLIAHKDYETSTSNLRCFVKLFKSKKIRLQKFYNSKTLPLKFTILKKDITFTYIYKPNTDLSNDLFVSLLSNHIFKILNIKYRMSKIYLNQNLIEIKESRTIKNFRNYKDLRNTILKDSYNSLNNFLKTYAISLLISYLFGVGDRTLDNMIIDSYGNFYNIDFEYILGDDPKIFIDFAIPDVISKFLKSDMLIYEKFKNLIIFYFNLIQESSFEILCYAKKLHKNGIFNFHWHKFEEYFKEKNSINNNFLILKIDSAIVDRRIKVIHFLNKVGKSSVLRKLLNLDIFNCA